MADRDRYEVLGALINARADAIGDETGWHHVAVGVLRDLHDWERGEYEVYGELAEAIFNRISDSAHIESFDEAGDEGA